ncbi:hypothetical protein GQ55_3G132500 [Panicum hallii var. hallii]|uniref:Uncharacterized protein n=1 Tax=Panicum hallii var. hallii TaxID=1504633 RepID=A0A2T7E8Y5_9POAL|nr:hypothetical protein GQ55_3G132500 [Panicum hallii var. hallii]
MEASFGAGQVRSAMNDVEFLGPVWEPESPPFPRAGGPRGNLTRPASFPRGGSSPSLESGRISPPVATRERRAACSAPLLALPFHLRSSARRCRSASSSRRHPCSSLLPVGDAPPLPHPSASRSATAPSPRPPPPQPPRCLHFIFLLVIYEFFLSFSPILPRV